MSERPAKRKEGRNEKRWESEGEKAVAAAAVVQLSAGHKQRKPEKQQTHKGRVFIMMQTLCWARRADKRVEQEEKRSRVMISFSSSSSSRHDPTN